MKGALTRTQASKYKVYNRIRETLAGKVTLPVSPKRATKRNSEDGTAQTPSKKRSSYAITPRKASTSVPQQEVPSPQQPSPIAKPTMIGPTPQKDGKLLGIFDILPSHTPSKGGRTILADLQPNVVETPSRKRKHADTEEVETFRHCKTPQSSAKRLMLDMFMTPQKPKDTANATPSSSMKAFATPAFLRRHTLPLEAINEQDRSPEQSKPWKRKSFGRSLSSMIAEMRRQEEHEHDEELDVLREMESGGTMLPVEIGVPEVILDDSKADVTLDVDGFAPSDIDYDLEDTREIDPSAPPKKVWKKKGLKRQTRRVNMRPVKKVVPVQPPVQPPQSDNDCVDEAQAKTADVVAQITHDADLDYSAEPTPKNGSGKLQQCKKMDSTTAADGQKPKRKSKANALAHTNFVRLKIKSKNSKAKGRGRFGRKR